MPNRLAFAGFIVMLAGCLGPAGPGFPAASDEPTNPSRASTPDGVPGAPPQPAEPTSEGGWRLDCALGSNSPAPWFQDCLVRTSRSNRTKAETWVGVNPTDPNNIVIAAKDMDPEASGGCVWNGVYVSHDTGRTWQQITIGGPFARREPTNPFYGYHCNTDPMFRFAADGKLHYGVELYNPAGLGDELYPYGGDVSVVGFKVMLATSHDGGLTWPDVITWQPDLVTITDYSRMAISPATGTILEAINHLDAGLRCQILSSRDAGKTADAPVPVTPKEAPGASLCRGLAVSANGTAVVLFHGSASPEGFLNDGHTTFVRSGDDGRTFLDSNPGFNYTLLPDRFPGMEVSNAPGHNIEIVYDLSGGPARGTLWCIYADGESGDGDVYVRRSPDDGRTWSEPVRVHSDSANHQWMPTLAVAQDGSMHAFWFDTRGDPEDHLVRVWHSLSLDGGTHWVEEPVSRVGWDPDLGRHQAGWTWVGDYIGSGSAGNEVWAAFPDTSLGGEPVVAAARVHRSA